MLFTPALAGANNVVLRTQNIGFGLKYLDAEKSYTGLDISDNYTLSFQVLAVTKPILVTDGVNTIVITTPGPQSINFIATSTSYTVRFVHLSFGPHARLDMDEFILSKSEAFSVISCDPLNDADYRYAFNGMEKDDEAKNGKGNHYSFGDRCFDPRIGRWLGVDDARMLTPDLSPYNFGANSPLVNIDPDGKKVYFAPGLGGYGKKGAEPNPYLRTIEFWFQYYGISNYVLKNSNKHGRRLSDARFVKNNGQKPQVKDPNWRVENAAQEIANDILANNIQQLQDEGKEKINLVGTSMGSVTIAQAAVLLLEDPVKYGLDEDFKIDNLVLLGTPINSGKPEDVYTDFEKTGSALYDKLKLLEEQGKLTLDIQNLTDDNVSGNAGATRKDARKYGMQTLLSFMADAKAIKKGAEPTHPHIKLALNPSFGQDMIRQIIGGESIIPSENAMKIEGEDKAGEVQATPTLDLDTFVKALESVSKAIGP